MPLVSEVELFFYSPSSVPTYSLLVAQSNIQLKVVVSKSSNMWRESVEKKLATEKIKRLAKRHPGTTKRPLRMRNTWSKQYNDLRRDRYDCRN